MPPKKRAAKAKQAESSSDSDSDSSSSESSSEEEAPKKAPAAKTKSKAKAKAKAEAAEEKAGAAEEKAEPAAEKGVVAAEVGSSDEEAEGAAEKPDEEPKKAVFQPPPRPVFRPHCEMGDITGAEDVLYCPDCGLPPDFCQYGPTWEKCKPWCMENVPHLYPELCNVSIDDAKKKAEEAADKGKIKELPGGKKKVEASPSVTIKKLTRGGRKCVTSVCGLETFGVKLDNAAKLFKKKFSCGASVVKGENGLPDTVDVQGDFEDEVVDLIVDEYKLPRAKVSFLEGGTKKKGKSGR